MDGRLLVTCALAALFGPACGWLETDHTPADPARICEVDCGGGTLCTVECARDEVCDAPARVCVDCLSSDDCDDDAPVCDLDAKTCFRCDDDADCDDVDASACDAGSGRCVACTAHDDCARFGDTPFCDATRGRCVECTGDTEAAACGANSCVRATGECSGVGRGSRSACQTCTADSECEAEHACVNEIFQGTVLGTRCMPLQTVTQRCGDEYAPLQPFSFPTVSTSVDGVAATKCALPPDVTCEAYADVATVCSGDTQCGAPDLDDGVCVLGLCSYSCFGPFSCSPTLECRGAPTVCRAP